MFVFATILPVDEDSDTVRKLMRNKRSAADFSLINDDNRQRVTTILTAIATREVTQIGHSAMSARTAEVLLLGMGNVSAIERQMAVYRDYGSRDAWQYIPQNFEWSKQPLITPYLAEELYLPGGTEPVGFSRDREVLVPNRSVFGGLQIVWLIKASDEFTPAMKTWAHEMHRVSIYEPDAFREQMRGWWKQNEDTAIP